MLWDIVMLNLIPAFIAGLVGYLIHQEGPRLTFFVTLITALLYLPWAWWMDGWPTALISWSAGNVLLMFIVLFVITAGMSGVDWTEDRDERPVPVK